MCVVSMIGDDWRRSFPQKYPWWPAVNPDSSGGDKIIPSTEFNFNITREEFEKLKIEHEEKIKTLKAEVEALKELLKAAKIYDEKTGQPDCEVDEKVNLIKKIAELLDVNMDDVF